MNNTFKLGKSIAQIIPFYRQRQELVEQQPKQQKEDFNLIYKSVLNALYTKS